MMAISKDRGKQKALSHYKAKCFCLYKAFAHVRVWKLFILFDRLANLQIGPDWQSNLKSPKHKPIDCLLSLQIARP